MTEPTRGSEPVPEDVIEGTAVEIEPTYELVPQAPAGHRATTLFGTDDPVDVVERAQRVAAALADVIEQRNLYKMISGKKHVLVEGWTLLGSMLGVFPITEWTRQLTDSKGKEAWEARVIAQTRDGAVVGTREAMCSRSENRWGKAEDHAIRSMAQTRAVSGALASPLRFIMELAGYSGTPEAEMHTGGGEEVRVEHTGPPKPPGSFGEALDRLVHLGHPQSDWVEWWLPQLIGDLFNKASTAELTSDERKLLGQRLGTVVLALESARETGDFPPPTRAMIQEAFATVTEGTVLEGPPWRIWPTEEERPTEAEFRSEMAGEEIPSEGDDPAPNTEQGAK